MDIAPDEMEAKAEPSPEQLAAAAALAAEEAEKARQQAAIDEQHWMLFFAAEANREENEREQARLAREQAAQEEAERAEIDAVLAESPSLTPDEARTWLAIEAAAAAAEAEKKALAARPCCPCAARGHARREVVRTGLLLGRCACPQHDGVAK